MAIENKTIILAIILTLSVALYSCVAKPQSTEVGVISDISNIPFEHGELNFTIEQIQFDFLDMDELSDLVVRDVVNDMILFTTVSTETLRSAVQAVPHDFMFLYDTVKQEIIAEIDLLGQERVIIDAIIFGDLIIYVDTDMYGRELYVNVKSYDTTTNQQTVIRTIQSLWRSEPVLRRVEGGYLILYTDLELEEYKVKFVPYNQEPRTLYSNSLEQGELFSPGHFHAFGDMFAFFESYQGNEYFFIGNICGEYQRIQLTKHVDDFSILEQGIVTSHAYPENIGAAEWNIISYLEFRSFDSQITNRLDGFRTFRKTTNGSAILGIADWQTIDGYHMYGRLVLITYINEHLYAYLIDFHEAGSLPRFVAVNDNTWLIVSSFATPDQDIGVFRLKVQQ